MRKIKYPSKLEIDKQINLILDNTGIFEASKDKASEMDSIENQSITEYVQVRDHNVIKKLLPIGLSIAVAIVGLVSINNYKPLGKDPKALTNVSREDITTTETQEETTIDKSAVQKISIENLNVPQYFVKDIDTYFGFGDEESGQGMIIYTKTSLYRTIEDFQYKTITDIELGEPQNEDKYYYSYGSFVFPYEMFFKDKKLDGVSTQLRFLREKQMGNYILGNAVISQSFTEGSKYTTGIKTFEAFRKGIDNATHSKTVDTDFVMINGVSATTGKERSFGNIFVKSNTESFSSLIDVDNCAVKSFTLDTTEDLNCYFVDLDNDKIYSITDLTTDNGKEVLNILNGELNKRLSISSSERNNINLGLKDIEYKFFIGKNKELNIGEDGYISFIISDLNVTQAMETYSSSKAEINADLSQVDGYLNLTKEEIEKQLNEMKKDKVKASADMPTDVSSIATYEKGEEYSLKQESISYMVITFDMKKFISTWNNEIMADIIK